MPTLAIYIVITSPQDTYNTMVEANFFATKLKLSPHVNPHFACCCHPFHNPKMENMLVQTSVVGFQFCTDSNSISWAIFSYPNY